ncbi:hypothetical protein DXG01_008309 [Tephrocybe rancida]|nr:hypothetical protein DXG01_008309 [Tephrocybe rancida]
MELDIELLPSPCSQREVNEHCSFTEFELDRGTFQEQIPPLDEVEIVQWSFCEVTGDKSVTRSTLSELSASIPAVIDETLGPTQPGDLEALYEEPTSIPRWKFDDNDDEAFTASIQSPSQMLQAPAADVPGGVDLQLTASDAGLLPDDKLAEKEVVKFEEDAALLVKAEPTPHLTSGFGEFGDIRSATLAHPAKRRRTLLDAVEITTPQWLRSRVRRIRQEIKVLQEKEFLNPLKPEFDIKRPKDAVEEGLGSVFRRVDALSIKPFAIADHLLSDHDLLYFTVCRTFTSSIYGGNPQQTFPKISKANYARHPYRDFMFINLTLNPYAPQRPGHAGLFYRTRASALPQELRVFIRIDDNVWLYLGQYELIPAAPLTKQEWATKSNETKKEWCERTSVTDWGKETRARIALRWALRREPTPEEVEEAGDGAGVSKEDIRNAFDRGEEVMKVLVMKCIGYDEVFQRELRDRRSAWTPPPPKDKRNKTKKKKKAVKEDSDEDVKPKPKPKPKAQQSRPAPGTGKAPGITGDSVVNPSKTAVLPKNHDSSTEPEGATWEEPSMPRDERFPDSVVGCTRKRKRQDTDMPEIIDLTDTLTDDDTLSPRKRRMPARYLSD